MEKQLDARASGDRLRQLRGDRTQAAVAKAIGVTDMAISQYEAGIRVPSDEIKLRLADFYGVGIERLFFIRKFKEEKDG